MVALCNKADHYIFSLWFLSSFFFFSSHSLSGRRLDVYHTSTHGVASVRNRMHVWNVLHAARWKYRTQKIDNFVGLYLRSWGMYRQSEKNLLNADTSSTCPHNMVNFGLLTTEICWRVWGTPANFNDFRVLAASLHGTLVFLRQPNFAALNRRRHIGLFGRATITLGIGPHSSYSIFYSIMRVDN